MIGQGPVHFEWLFSDPDSVHILTILLPGYVHKIHIYLEYHSVCPLVQIGTPPPEPKKGGHTCLRLRGWGEKKPSTLSTLWVRVTT